ncbi:uncharacterized protein PRCAT00005893001 [Priceomyces carsonii]|uniref:uncharacterized protein n=1 Tax=Priceomyces carsonii TaxID=28549 RepID=UPI002ED8E45A|nr:unnamed protein product [Priceomyces carsonii]
MQTMRNLNLAHGNVQRKSRSQTRGNETGAKDSVNKECRESHRHGTEVNRSRESSVRGRSRESSLHRKKRFGREGNVELLQTALSHNHQMSSKSTSSTNMSTRKNISTTHETTRPQIRKWNSYTSANSDSGLSPLTVIRSQPGEQTTKQLLNPDNSFRSLSLQGSIEQEGTQGELEDTDTKSRGEEVDGKMYILPSSSSSQPANKLYNKINLIIKKAHNSMNSLVPITSGSKEIQPSMNSGNISNYQSESDDDTETQIDVWTPQTLDLPEIRPKDANKLWNEASDFQNTLINKFNMNINNYGNEIPTKFGRVQQKVLDFKELYASEPPSVQLNGNVQSYDIKIQHDTLMNQYTSIRLRFGSKIASGKGQLKTDTGILGFINRKHRSNNMDIQNDKYKPLDNLELTPRERITIDNKSEYVASMWKRALNSSFNREPPQDPTTSELETQDDDDIFSKETSSLDLSAIARGVKFNQL